MKLLRKIHLWLSVPFGVIFSITCLTGAILVFEKEITNAIRPEAVQTQAESHPSEAVQTESRHSATYHSEAVQTESADQPRHAGNSAARHSDEGRSSENPSSAEQQAKTRAHNNQRLPFFQTVFKLHRWLLDAPTQRGANSVGKIIVGISTLLMVFVLISGIIIWIPKNLTQLKNRLKVSVSNGWLRFWHDSHVSLGIYVSIFLLIMAITGLTWSFSWFREGFVSVFDSVVEPSQMRHFIYSLHTGSWGGMITRIIYFLSALIGAFLPWTGYYLWFKKHRKH